jgi:anti-sigma factor RsiW
MNLHFDDASLLKYLKEELSPEEQSAIDAHLEVCEGRRCAAALERLARSPAGGPLFVTAPLGLFPRRCEIRA